MKYRAVIAALLVALGRFMGTVPRLLMSEWLMALLGLWRKWVEICLRWRAQRQLPERVRRAADAPCVPLNERAFRHPDPMIYAQYDLMARGYAVTWDNPDIELRKGGAPVPSSQVDPNTEYEIVARIWNNSTDAVAVGLPVIFSYLDFGIGVKSIPIGATSVLHLGVKGGPSHPAFTSIKWKTPATPGHYCLQVFLAATDDTNFHNNLGQENLDVGQAQSPAAFTFQLRNQSMRAQRFRFDVDTYALPPLQPCDRRSIPRRGVGGGVPLVGATRPAIPAAHDRRNYPVPQGWFVQIEPGTPELPPEGTTRVQVRITPPTGFTGRQPFNVNAFDEQGFVGGVTLYVEAP